MGKAFGRARRREARERIAELEQQVKTLKTENNNARIRARTATDSLYRVYSEIERTIDKHSSLLPLKTERGNPLNLQVQVERLAPFDSIGEMSDPVQVERIVLYKIRVKALRDVLRKALAVKVSDGKREVGIYVSDLARESLGVEEDIAWEVGQRVIAALREKPEVAQKG